MRYILMHKNIPAAELEADDKTGHITKLYEIYSPEHLPVGVTDGKDKTARAALDEWWTDRSIPSSRSGLKKALEALGVSSRLTLLTRCYGLSLTDQYWIKPENSDVVWSSVNFFENDFSEDMGDILFGKPVAEREPDLLSPDITTDGNLKKRWIISEGKRCLIKAGSKPFFQQPFNEIIASAVMRRLGIPHTDYRLIWDENEPYCVCGGFADSGTELVTAWRIMMTQKQPNHISRYQHCVNCFEGLGIKGTVSALDQMITVDYIIANEDRHLNNFGAIRDAGTLEWVGIVPIFDSGSSLGYELEAAQIRGRAAVECKPFKKHHREQLKLVTSFDWLDFSKLEGIGDEIAEIFSGERTSAFIDSARISAITAAVGDRIENVRRMAETMQPWTVNDSTEDDVSGNTARSYGS